jgi:hypothetical protein
MVGWPAFIQQGRSSQPSHPSLAQGGLPRSCPARGPRPVRCCSSHSPSDDADHCSTDSLGGRWISVLTLPWYAHALPRQPRSPFIPAERDLIRLELMPRFGQNPTWRTACSCTWRDGPQKGQPKIPKALQTALFTLTGSILLLCAYARAWI